MIKYFARSEPKYSTLFHDLGSGPNFCGVDDVKHFVNYSQVGGHKGNRFNHYHLKKCHGSEKYIYKKIKLFYITV